MSIRANQSFVKTHSKYGDIVFDYANNKLFHQKIESVQYNVALMITGAFRGRYTAKRFNKLDLQHLKYRR